MEVRAWNLGHGILGMKVRACIGEPLQLSVVTIPRI